MRLCRLTLPESSVSWLKNLASLCGNVRHNYGGGAVIEHKEDITLLVLY